MTRRMQPRMYAFALILTLVFCLFTMLPLCAAAGDADITLRTPDDLIALSRMAISEIDGKTIVLANDMDMAGQDAIAPIGGGSAFNGVFDGQGHYIKNLSIKGTGNCTGLFGHVGTEGSITRLGLYRVNVTGDSNIGTNTGAFAGVLTGSVTECCVTGRISGMRYTGGVAGMLHAGTIENCWVDVDFSGSRYCGGLFGGSDYNTRYDQTVYGNKYSPLSAVIQDKNMVVRNNLTLGSVSANRFSGGILGDMGNSKASGLDAFEGNVAWTTAVTNAQGTDGGQYYGPVFAWWSKGREIPAIGRKNLYWSGMSLVSPAQSKTPADCQTHAALNIHAATTEELRTQSTYENLGWDFENVWMWEADLGHPVLRNVAPPPINRVRDVYVGTAEEFLAICDPLQFEELSNDHIYLTANIDMAGHTIAPIGGSSAFSGLLDGQDHIIKNLTIRGVGVCTGLFGYVDTQGRIQNLGLEGVSVTGSSPGTNTGALAGVLTGSVNECFVTGNIKGARYTGGVAGLLHAGVIENCWTDVVFDGTRYCGGLFGGTDYDTRYGSGYSPLSSVIDSRDMVVRNNLTLGAVAANRYPAGIMGEMSAGKSSGLDAFEGNVAWTSSITARNADISSASGSAYAYYGPVFADWKKDLANVKVNAANLYWDEMALVSLQAIPSSTQSELYAALQIKTADKEQLGTQQTYEALGWDFEHTWVWSHKLGHPVLHGFDEPALPGEQKTPASLVTTYAASPKTTRAFTWYTDTTVADTIVQAVPADRYAGESSFASSAAIIATGTVYELKTSDTTARNIHQVNVTGLTAGTTYRYRAGDGKNWSPVYTFDTEPADSDAFTFFSMTDTQDQYTNYANTLKHATAAYPDGAFILHSGDVIQNNITADYDEIFKVTRQYVTTLPTMVSPGNHELAKDTQALTSGNEEPDYVKGIDNYKSHYLYPSNGPENGDQIIYSFDYGDAHFVCLNSNILSGYSYPSYAAQIKWLEEDLRQAADKAWKIVSIHVGPYNASGSGKGNAAVIEAMETLGVDLVLFGHNHIFVRSNPITGGKQETITPVDGVYYATAGSPSYYSSGCAGGAAGKGGNSQYFAINNLSFGDSAYGAITVTEDTLTIRSHSVPNKYKNNASQLLDTYVITKPTADGSVVAAAPVYNGEAQPLIASASTDKGVLLYSLDGVNFSPEIPTGTDAGSYTVWYQIKGDANHGNSAVHTLTATISALDIAAADLEITLGAPLVYTGSKQTQTIESVTANGLNVTYSVSGNTGVDAGSYTLSITGTGNFTGTATALWNIAVNPDYLPQTGDDSSLALWAAAAAIAVLCLLLNKKRSARQ